MPDIDAITEAIDARLPLLAQSVIRSHLDLSQPANQHFLDHPDAREQHQTRWHQWGIITHTRVFLRHFDADIPRYLREWGLWDSVDNVLSQPIDDATRWHLLRISVLLHDIGKFGARTQGKHRFHFSHHEDLTGEIIRCEMDLSTYGLSSRQVEYIAHTAEDHFVLGLVRRRAREDGRYDEAFAGTPDFRQLCLTIAEKHPMDFVEIGVLFLGDSLAKVDPKTGPADAVSQYQTNIVFARQYLELALDDAP